MAIAGKRSSRAARRAGRGPATKPTSAPTARIRPSRTTGIENPVSVSPPRLRTSPQPRRRGPAGALAQLTEREREVMALVAEGLSNEEIAQKLFVSSATAKTHVSRAMVKLRARGRARLVVFAYESGLVRPGWLD